MNQNYTSWGAFPRFRDYPDILDIGQMCELLGISTKTGYRLLRENKIEHLKVGRSYRIPKIHVLAYFNICSRQPQQNNSN